MKIFYHSFTDSKDNLPRIIVVAYSYDKTSQQVSYGAAIFKKESPSETFQKALLRNTACKRLELRPVTFTSQKQPTVHISFVEKEIINSILNNNYLVRSRERRLNVQDMLKLN